MGMRICYEQEWDNEVDEGEEVGSLKVKKF